MNVMHLLEIDNRSAYYSCFSSSSFWSSMTASAVHLAGIKFETSNGEGLIGCNKGVCSNVVISNSNSLGVVLFFFITDDTFKYETALPGVAAEGNNAN